MVLELAQLLVNTLPRAPGARRSLQLSNDRISTEYGCHRLNAHVKTLTKADLEWTDAMTWTLVREVVNETNNAADKSALQALLALDEYSKTERDERRTVAISALGLDLKPNSIRMKYDEGGVRYDAHVLLRVVPGLKRSIERALTQPLFGRRAEGLARQADVRQESAISEVLGSAQERTLRKLRVLPPYMPDHLDIERLARDLTVQLVDDLDETSRRQSSLYSDSNYWGESLSASNVFDTEQAFVLLGNPGSGKSTALAAHCVRQIESRTSVVVFARVEEVARVQLLRRATTAREAMQVVIEAWDAWRDGHSLSADVVGELLSRTDLLFAIDGLDEVSSPLAREAAVGILQLLRDHRAAIRVTSRLTGYEPPWAEARQYFLELLPQTAAEVLVDDWFGKGSDTAKERATAALENPQISQAARIPLIAGFVCFVASGDKVSATVSGLYRQYLARFLRQTWKPASHRRPTELEVAAALEVAKHVAWTMVGSGRTDQVPTWADIATLNELMDQTGRSGAVVGLFQDDGLLVAYGLPEDDDPFSQQVRWLHRTIHEHLVGRELADLIARNYQRGIEVLTQAALRPSWAAVLEHSAPFIARTRHLDACIATLSESANDSATGRVRRFALRLAAFSAKPVPRILVNSAIARGHWYELALAAPRDLVDGIANYDPSSSAASPHTGAAYALRSIELELDDFNAVSSAQDVSDRSGKFAYDRVLANIDPVRAINRMIQSIGDWPNRVAMDFPVFSFASGEQRIAILREAESAIATRSPNVTAWLEAAANLEPREDKIVEIAIRGASHGSSVLMADYRSSQTGVLMDFDSFAEKDTLDFLRGEFGDRSAFEMGWNLGSMNRTLPEGSGQWARIACAMAVIDWERGAPDPEISADCANKQLDIRVITPESVEAWLAAVCHMVAHPTTELVRTFFRSAAGDSANTRTDSPLSIDAGWVTQLNQAIPWKMRFEVAAELLREGTLDARSLWHQLTDALHMGYESGDFEFASAYTEALGLLVEEALPLEVRHDEGILHYLPLHVVAGRDSIELIFELHRRARRSGDRLLIENVDRVVDSLLYSQDQLAKYAPLSGDLRSEGQGDKRAGTRQFERSILSL